MAKATPTLPIEAALRRAPRAQRVTVVVAMLAFGACTTAEELTVVRSNPADCADLVIRNARVSVKKCSPADAPDAPVALAIRDGRIVAIGGVDTLAAHRGSQTRVVDAEGRRVLPGFTDSHTHLIGGGLQLGRLEMRDLANKAELIAAVGRAAQALDENEWLLGRGWTVDSWKEQTEPAANWIDAVTRQRPAYLVRMDGHQALANTAALRLAGIDQQGPADPPGGEIERDPKTGAPTGILKESAMDLVSNLIPAPTAEQRYAALLRAQAHAHALGVTSVHDMSEPSDLETFTRAAEAGTLTLRIYVYVHAESDWADWLSRLGDRSPGGHLRVRGIKAFMDGSLGSRTAYMREPYRDADPDEHYPRGQLTEWAQDAKSRQSSIDLADRLGGQMAVHAIGDEANHLLLDAYESARERLGHTDRRHRVEHAQHLLVSDIPRFAQLGAVASMQPLHKADDGRYADRALTPAQLRGSYAYRELLDAGALLCFGSDWPVVSMNPWLGVDAAVRSRTLAGDVWLPEHAITVEEAITAYTSAPAQAVGVADRLGSVAVGQLADLVILDRDPLACPPEQLREIKPTHTIVAGQVVYEAP